MRAKVLLYHIGKESERDRALRDVLRERKLLTLDVTEAQLGETVGRLVSTNAADALPQIAPKAAPDMPDALPGTVPEAEFMLLCALGDRQLDRLLAAMRRAGAVVPYKAVLTEQNRGWTLERLIREVAREHEALSGR